MTHLFEEELITLLNVHGKDSETDTPDYILASYLCHCVDTFREVVATRDTLKELDKQPDEVVTGVHPSLKAPLDLYGREAGVRLGASAKPIYDAIKTPWDGGREPKVPVEGHASDCEINLDWEWTPCTCEAG